MRINWYWRGIDLLDIEIHVLRPRVEEDEGPRLEASGGGQFELSGDGEGSELKFGFCR